MPTYDYICKSCNSKHEVRHGIHEEPHVVCDNCGKDTMEKLITVPPTVTYNGKWFKNDGKY